MSSFWTPGGEHPVDRPEDGPPVGAVAPGRQGLDGGLDEQLDAGGDDLTPGGRARLEAEAAAMTAELAATPAAVVVANHVVGLFQLATIHLNQDPPHLEDGRLAIDAVQALLDAAGPRLGEDGEALRTGLTQLQLAYVELHRRSEAAAVDGAGPSGPPAT